MEFKRLPRFKRIILATPINLADRDRRIIRLIYRHRFLRSSHIIALIGGAKQPLLRRLQLLFHHGYLERPRAQLDYYHRGGSQAIVYGLGSKGGKLMKQELGTAFQKARWGEKNRVVGRMFLEHALLVSEVMVAFELACRRDGRARLIHEYELPRKEGKSKSGTWFRWNVTLHGGIHLGLIPDRTFAVEYVTAAGTTDRAYFFLEADRGTMPVRRRSLAQTSFHRKLLAYAATWSLNLHRRRFGFHRFRVLTVTKSADRVTSFINACGTLDRGQGLFLFAQVADLQDSEILRAAIWRSGRRSETTSLLNSSNQAVGVQHQVSAIDETPTQAEVNS